MASQSSHSPCCLLFSLACVLLITHIGASEANRKVYIVYMGHQTKDDSSASSLHMSMLREVVGSDSAKHLLHSYKKGFNGFLAKLTEEETKKMAEMEGVVSVFPSKANQLHTTRSWDFIGMPLQVKRSTVESNVIVGVLDSGIWPESYSFNGEGFGSPPSKWKGICHPSFNFTCNNKIVGARYYRLDGEFPTADLQSPRDSQGHGTHTASTVAGNVVNTVSLDGLGLGTARGGVPSARIAVYKVCWSDGCFDHDILAAFEDAIADGVDIISMSVGTLFAREHFIDALGVGAFHAMKMGILTSASAGNEGPNPQTTSSVSPWTLSVAASTIDRKFFTVVQLGNNMVYDGISINTFKHNGMYPFIHGVDAPNTQAGFNGSISRFCIENSLDKNLVKDKLVFCEGNVTGRAQVLSGAVGYVTQTRGANDVAFSHPLPTAVVGLNQGRNISNYIRTTRKPTAVIYKSTERKDALAPYVAAFSSRGPNPISRNILKPDITAPGVDIVAAWSQIAPVSGAVGDQRRVPYNIISGTSMACPHVTGVAVYIKTFHPTWSPAAIKSALMTTASPMSPEMSSGAEFAYGAGHINPTKVLDPGLIYDANEDDYVRFLCGQAYTANHINLITGNDKISCSEFENGSNWDLNYPSFTLSTFRNEPIGEIFNRTVTNVGSPISTYKALVTPPSGYGIGIQVEPSILKFNYVGQKLDFMVIITGVIDRQQDPFVSSSLIWEDGVHRVRSPIVVYAPS